MILRIFYTINEPSCVDFFPPWMICLGSIRSQGTSTKVGETNITSESHRPTLWPIWCIYTTTKLTMHYSSQAADGHGMYRIPPIAGIWCVPMCFHQLEWWPIIKRKQIMCFWNIDKGPLYQQINKESWWTMNLWT